MEAIQIKNVTKRYNNVTALDNVSFSFEAGKIYGFLGRNGAGKSTLINIIANRIFADAGEILIDDMPAWENINIHEKIYCMSEKDLYDTGLKIWDIFKWTARFYEHFDLEKACEISKKFGLDINKKFKALSKGYQSIFKLTVALSLNVPYVIFDEPVLGLDANHRELFYHLLLEDYETNQKTIIIATHLIEEVANLIEKVVLIDKGRVVLLEDVAELMDMGYCVSGIGAEVDAYCLGKNVIGTDELGGLKLAYIMGTREALPKDSRLQISNINLQKLFVKLTETQGGNGDE